MGFCRLDLSRLDFLLLGCFSAGGDFFSAGGVFFADGAASPAASRKSRDDFSFLRIFDFDALLSGIVDKTALRASATCPADANRAAGFLAIANAMTRRIGSPDWPC